MITYTNAQFRSILFGLGYVAKEVVDLSKGFPVTSDNSPLTGPRTVEGIKNFQADYALVIDGIVGPKTMAKAEQVMRILQYELNLVINAGLPKDQPYYGPKTVTGVRRFQSFITVEETGVATRELRLRLDELAKQKA